MSQIEIQILKQGFESKKIISLSFFTMNDPYRDFTRYQKYLERFLDYTKPFKDFEVRIYTDDSGKDFALQISQDNQQVSIYHFNCPEFRDPKGKGHIGVFGPIVRFLPLFEDHDIVWISDIDVRESFLDPLILKNKFDFSISTYPCYFRESFNQKYTIIAHRIISRIKLPRALLTRFLTKLSNGDLQDKIDLLNKENIDKPKSKVPYCTDELFLNTVLYSHLKKYDLKILILLDKILIGLIPGFPKNLSEKEEKVFYKYSIDSSEINKQKLREVFQEIISKYEKKYPCLSNISLDELEESFAIKSSEL
jgi:hypothetical protein